MHLRSLVPLKLRFCFMFGHSLDFIILQRPKSFKDNMVHGWQNFFFLIYHFFSIFHAMVLSPLSQLYFSLHQPIQ